MELPPHMNLNSNKNRSSRMNTSDRNQKIPFNTGASQKLLNPKIRWRQARGTNSTLGPIRSSNRDLFGEKMSENTGIQNSDGNTYISPKTIMRHTRNRLNQIHTDKIQNQEIMFLFKKDSTHDEDPVLLEVVKKVLKPKDTNYRKVLPSAPAESSSTCKYKSSTKIPITNNLDSPSIKHGSPFQDKKNKKF